MKKNVYEMVDQIKEDINLRIQHTEEEAIRDHNWNMSTCVALDHGIIMGLKIALDIINYHVDHHRFEDDRQIMMDLLFKKGGDDDEKR